jgi:hypothetical protein
MFDELDNFMRQTESTLILGNRQMYFDDGEWVVADLLYGGKRQHVIDRFLDAVPNALSDALRCLAAPPAAPARRR